MSLKNDLTVIRENGNESTFKSPLFIKVFDVSHLSCLCKVVEPPPY